MKRITLHDDRVLRWGGQFVFAVILVLIISAMYGNTVNSLTQRGMLPGFSFLRLSAGYDIGESIVPFTRDSSNLRAIMVGILNTLSISLIAIVFATVLGIFIGLCRLSSNWLVKNIALSYIELIRNIPLLVLLLFWYRAVFLELNSIKNAIILGRFVTEDGMQGGRLIISNRGVAMTWFHAGPGWQVFWNIVIAGAVIAIASGIVMRRHGLRTGRKHLTILWSMLIFLGIAAIGWLLIPEPVFISEVPVIKGFNAIGGLHISAEWGSLFSGLVLYTSAFVAEAVRAGIQGVDRGQIEAARSLGFSNARTMRLIVLPQAMRITVPPLTSIYLGVAKNTSLGVAIGYPDLFAVIGTMMNQTGRSLELIIIVMTIYLGLSLTMSLIMNVYNNHIQLVEK